MRFLYNCGIWSYYLGILIASIFNTKAKQWVVGRKNIFNRIKNSVNNNEYIIWVHCASLGEFEQGRPVIESVRSGHPEYKILITFFSSSGYEIRKNYASADYIFYLPIDTPKNAKRFIKLINPCIAIFIKYEFWYNYLFQLKKKNIPVYLVSGIFRPKHHFFQWYGAWFRKGLKTFTHFFVQNTISEQLLKGIGLINVTISGDTRFDRVVSIASQAKEFPLVKKFAGKSKVFLAGSSWPEDETLIFELIKTKKEGLKFIFAPHEVHAEHIRSLLEKLPEPALKFSEANEENIHSADILIIDSIGILSGLYRYATIAYIGGGFGKSIHNILEAATFGIPVIFGTNYHKFQEAYDLIERGGAFSISNAEALIQITNKLLENKKSYDSSATACRNYVLTQKGATEKVLSLISSKL